MSIDTDSYSDRAIQWAVNQLGSTGYPLRCLAFVEDAYELGNGIVLAGYSFAREAADAYNAAAQTSIPPRGTFVFYDCWGTIDGDHRNWGHVGLSLDEGCVIHAWDHVRIDDYLELQELSPAEGWTQPRYVGWAPVAEILKGMTTQRSDTRGQ